MPGYGGERPGSGRRPGSRNKRTLEAIKAAEDRLTPLEFLMSIYRDASSDLARRIESSSALRASAALAGQRASKH